MPDAESREQIREQLYELMDDSTLSVIEKQRQALELGRQFLDVKNGHIQRPNDDEATDEVVVSVGDDPTLLPEGTTLERASTYCRRTVESHSPIALSHASAQGWEDDPAYVEHGFECYLGTTIFAGGDTYGTVCFISRDAREDDFTAEEQAFVELLARLLGRDIDASRAGERIDRIERAKQRSERKYRALVRLAPDAIFLADAETTEIEEINEEALELTGYAEAELQSMSILDLHPAAKRDQYAQLFDSGPWANPRSELQDGTPIVLRHAKGSDVPIEVSVSPVTIDDQEYVYGIVRDVSSRRQRERELRVKNQAIEESTVGITIGDATKPDNPIMYANRGFTRLTGYSKSRIIGDNCRFLQGEGTDESTVDAIREAVETETPIRTEILNYRADGTPFWNKLTIAPVSGDGSDEVTHYVGIQEDITAEKRRTRLIEVLNRVLRHNLGNDMTAIRGFAGVIGEQTTGEPARMADRIQQATDRLIALSDKARTFQTTVTGTNPPQPRDPMADISAVVTELREAFPETQFTVEGETDVEVLATESLQLVLSELGENAAKHSDGMPVLFRVETAADGSVAVHVVDDGPGLPDIEQQVLDAGYETPLNHSSGIGLWLVNWIITGFGGEVSTSHDDGTTVTVRLPAGPDNTGAHIPSTALSTDSQ